MIKPAEIEPRFQLVKNIFVRIAGMIAILLLSGSLFSGTQIGCSAYKGHICGLRISPCEWESKQADCLNISVCEWREGCASGCRRATSSAECGQHLQCGINSLSECLGFGCEVSGHGPVQSEQECGALADCNWEPSCWTKKALPCDPNLSEEECRDRNCMWEEDSAQL